MAFVTDPAAYDVVLIGGHLLPGEVHLEVMRELATQGGRGSGDDGDDPKFRGLKPCEFTIRLRLHSDDDENNWGGIAPKIFDLNRPSNRNIFSVVHPQIQRMGISHCIIIGIGEKKPMNGDPIEVTIKCRSAKRRTNATHKPKGLNDAKPGVQRGFGADYFSLLPVNEQTRQALRDAYFVTYGPGQPEPAAVKDRTPTAAEQLRQENRQIDVRPLGRPF